MRDFPILLERSAPHSLHASDRVWPETNCYLDLWIELLHGLGRNPLPLLGLAAALDWEVDHFTFLKPNSADLSAASGIVVHELAFWREVSAQVIDHVRAGSVPILEVDAFFLPDTQANAYRHLHTKTTIAIIGGEPETKTLDYLHNGGRFRLTDDDYDGVLGLEDHRPVLFPFAEFARLVSSEVSDTEAKALARIWLGRNAATRRGDNPVVRFAAALPSLMALTGTDPQTINALCFNTTRQLGGAFGLFADHLAWLGEDPADAAALAQSAKTLQFQIARAARRGRVEPTIDTALETMAALWERCMSKLGVLPQLLGRKAA